ncbi:protein SPMIP7 isoform X2 [Pseudophryne corroboree]|uniref:protein SPMIP7 isoform X2 n=1 Tax=Pseudophryne corroboree TaxID=495146 RepID=UPI003081A43F
MAHSTQRDRPSVSPKSYLHPLRDDVTVVDPCSGFVSPGADADMRPGTGKSIPCLVDDSEVRPQEADPGQQRRSHHLHKLRCVTAPPGGAETRKAQYRPKNVSFNGTYEAAVLSDLVHKSGTLWNSMARSDAALRATLGGWTSKIKAVPQVTRGPGTSLTQTFVLQSNDAACSRDDIVRKFMYTSSTQRAYEEVPWDMKLPAKLQPPESVREKMPLPFSQQFTLKRYDLQPETSQDTGETWDRLQKRMFHVNKKPLTFISPYPHIGHIPGYCGLSGSVNSEDVDNPNTSFIPFTKVRTVQPRYSYTAHTPNIPGYTGRVHWMAIHPANSNLPSPFLSADTKMNGSLFGSRTGTTFQHQGPLSKMVTTVSPHNPFNKVEKQMIE